MAERRKFSLKEYAIGVGIVLAAFVVVHLAVALLNLSVPQWVLSAVSAAIGVAVWFAIIGRKSRAK